MKKLLKKHYGLQWESHHELEYYKNILNNTNDDFVEEDEPTCDPPTAESNIMI